MKRKLMLHRPAAAVLAVGAACRASPSVAFQQQHPASPHLHRGQPAKNNCQRRARRSANDNCNAYTYMHANGGWRRRGLENSRSSPALFLSERTQTLDLPRDASRPASGGAATATRSARSGSDLTKPSSSNSNSNSNSNSSSSSSSRRQNLAGVSDSTSMQLQQLQGGTLASEGADAEYRRGLLTIGFITLLFSSMSPALHAALADTSAAAAAAAGGVAGHGHAPPPVLLLNAVVSVVALCGLVVGGPLLEASTPLPRSLALVENSREGAADGADTASTEGTDINGKESGKQRMLLRPLLGAPDIPLEARAGLELGLWKMLGTTANLYGLSLTTADHGAFLIQLTTLIVPVVQGIMGVPIPGRIKTAIALALGGVFLFTSDPSAGTCSASADAAAAANSNLALGDALCVVAAGFYATYDLRLFKYGKLVKARQLITGKILTQAVLSVLLVAAVGYGEASDYLATATWENCGTIPLLALWAGLAVNAVAPFLQVGGQQAVGPTRAQTLYASQPLWASILSFVFLGETVGRQGIIGGALFLSALFLAATAEPPESECGVQNCEV